MGVEDADFFLPERQTDLPLIGVSVPTSLFFYIAPFLGAMLYIHMHLYLLKLWKALGELPTDPNRPAGEGIAPWIVSDMALARRAGTVHAYPLQWFAQVLAVLSIFAAGPAVLAWFWWRSMPKHDAWLTIMACGLPLFFALLFGVESWRSLRRGGTEARHMTWRRRVGWGAGLAGLSVIGFLTTEGGFTDRFLRPAQLQDVVFVETPPDWLPHDEAEQVFRREWCATQGIARLACGPGPLARDYEGEKIESPGFLPQQRVHWCREVIDEATLEECNAFFAELDEIYSNDWRKTRKDAVDALPTRDLSGADLRNADLMGAQLEGANLWQARMEGAVLVQARMEGADLREARMEGAENLSEALLRGASLRFSDYSNVPFAQKQVNDMFGDVSVILSEGLDRPAHWPDWDLPWSGEYGFGTQWRKWQADPEGYRPPPKPEG
jgi:hypothetical protein